MRPVPAGRLHLLCLLFCWLLTGHPAGAVAPRSGCSRSQVGVSQPRRWERVATGASLCPGPSRGAHNGTLVVLRGLQHREGGERPVWTAQLYRYKCFLAASPCTMPSAEGGRGRRSLHAPGSPAPQPPALPSPQQLTEVHPASGAFVPVARTPGRGLYHKWRLLASELIISCVWALSQSDRGSRDGGRRSRQDGQAWQRGSGLLPLKVGGQTPSVFPSLASPRRGLRGSFQRGSGSGRDRRTL